MPEIVPLEWRGDCLRILDQTKLPLEQAVVLARTYTDVVNAIKSMQVRGAPAIGVAGAYAMVLASRAVDTTNMGRLQAYLRDVANQISKARPTAVNLTWAINRMTRIIPACQTIAELRQKLEDEATAIHREDISANKQIGALGAKLLPDEGAILTHCNAGALATAGYGTALGMIRAAWEQGHRLNVLVTETRPLLQGARLTAWELNQMGIPTYLLVDSAAGSAIRRGEVRCVIVGADRITANGDIANKIGTYTLAVLAHENGIPFYVAAPTATLDISLSSGSEIVIEERDADEVVRWGERSTAPKGIQVRNPAFDVTPAKYVTAIISERGIAYPPYEQSLRNLSEEASAQHEGEVPQERVASSGSREEGSRG